MQKIFCKDYMKSFKDKMMEHRSIKRIKKRILEEIVATKKVAQVTSWVDALVTFVAKVDIQIMNHNGYKEYPLFKKHLLKKHEVMMQYFEKTFSDFLECYNYKNALNNGIYAYDKNIWVCWWQGEDQAPEIVKKCIESIRKNAPHYNVVIITDENYKQYVSFPNWIEEKKSAGIISRTHYSDLLRLELLARYGGLWIDSTFLCVNSDVEDYFEWPLWSVKRPDYFHASIASGYFANYSLGCDSEHRKIYAVIRDFALEYWKTNNMMIDYLFLDYLIVLAQRHCTEVSNAFSKIPPNNSNCDELYKVLGKPYSQEKWQHMKENTALFKLSWKQQYPTEVKGEKTFYGKLIAGELN